MVKDFEAIPHTADIEIRVYGRTLEELFRHALIGMFQSIGPQTNLPECRVEYDRLICDIFPRQHEIEVQSFDINSLLVDFLSEALYLSDVYDQAYLDVDIHQLTPKSIKATLHGIDITGFEVVEIKAVTYHDLDIKQRDGIWQTDIVFDI